MKLFEVIQRMRDVSTTHKYVKSFHTGKSYEVNKRLIKYPAVFMSFPYTKNSPQGFGINDTVRYSFDVDILTNQYYGFDITGTTSADTFNTNYMISSDVDEDVDFKDENKLRETSLSIGQHIISKILNDDFSTIGYDFNLINYQIKSLERVNNDFVTGIRLRMEIETSNPYDCEYESFFTPTIPVVLCKSLSFDGINEYIDCSNNSAFDFNRTDPFSFETWVKFDTLTGFNFLVSKTEFGGVPVARGYYLSTDGNQLKFIFFNTNANLFSTQSVQTVSTGVWHHVIMSYDGSSSGSGVNFYLDGTLLTTSIITDNLTSDPTTTTVPLQIGGQNTSFLTGDIAKTRIWNTELTAGDVTTMYNGGVIQETPVKSANLILDLDIPTATWNGTEYGITDLSSTNATCITSNMDVVDLVDDCPST